MIFTPGFLVLAVQQHLEIRSLKFFHWVQKNQIRGFYSDFMRIFHGFYLYFTDLMHCGFMICTQFLLTQNRVNWGVAALFFLQHCELRLFHLLAALNLCKHVQFYILTLGIDMTWRRNLDLTLMLVLHSKVKKYETFMWHDFVDYISQQKYLLNIIFISRIKRNLAAVSQ